MCLDVLQAQLGDANHGESRSCPLRSTDTAFTAAEALEQHFAPAQPKSRSKRIAPPQPVLHRSDGVDEDGSTICMWDEKAVAVAVAIEKARLRREQLEDLRCVAFDEKRAKRRGVLAKLPRMRQREPRVSSECGEPRRPSQAMPRRSKETPRPCGFGPRVRPGDVSRTSLLHRGG